MVIEWREMEHDVVYRKEKGYFPMQKSIQICGTYKFWNIGSMRAQSRLLQMLIDYWDPDTEVFNLDV